jgi:hypothetical protein
MDLECELPVLYLFDGKADDQGKLGSCASECNWVSYIRIPPRLPGRYTLHTPLPHRLIFLRRGGNGWIILRMSHNR